MCAVRLIQRPAQGFEPGSPMWTAGILPPRQLAPQYSKVDICMCQGWKWNREIVPKAIFVNFCDNLPLHLLQCNLSFESFYTCKSEFDTIIQ